MTQGMREMAGLPCPSGGFCIRNAERLRTTTSWASWADILPMIRPRHPEVADRMVLSLSHGRGGFHFEGAAECRDRLVAAGIDILEWSDVDRGQRPDFHPDDKFPSFSSSPSRQHRWRKCSSTTRCGPVWSPPNKHWFDRSGARWLESHSAVLPSHPLRVLILSVSGSSSCYASGARFPSRLLSAGVANHLTLVATTVQLARHQGCSDDEASLWKAALRGSVEPGCPPTSGSRILTSFLEFELTNSA